MQLVLTRMYIVIPTHLVYNSLLQPHVTGQSSTICESVLAICKWVFVVRPSHLLFWSLIALSFVLVRVPLRSSSPWRSSLEHDSEDGAIPINEGASSVGLFHFVEA